MLMWLEESLYNAHSRGNILKEVASRRIHTVVPKSTMMKKDEAPKLKN